MFNKDSFITNAYGSISERDRALCKSLYSTTHWKLDNSQVSYRNQISNYKRSTFLRHKVIRALPNARIL